MRLWERGNRMGQVSRAVILSQRVIDAATMKRGTCWPSTPKRTSQFCATFNLSAHLNSTRDTAQNECESQRKMCEGKKKNRTGREPPLPVRSIVDLSKNNTRFALVNVMCAHQQRIHVRALRRACHQEASYVSL